MQKHIFGRKFKRDVNERRALFKGLASSLVLEERIKTTEEKAKAIRPQVEKLVTKAKKTTDVKHAYALLQPYLTSLAVKKLMTDVAPRFQSRNGGYTRIVKTGNRFSDNASMVIMEWVEKKPVKADGGKPQKSPKTESVSEKADAAVAASLYGGKEKKEAKAKTKSEKPKRARKSTEAKK